MALPFIAGEFGVVKDPEVRFTDKGSMWVKIRGVAKDRVRGSNGDWTDGPPLYVDIVFGDEGQGSKATHLVDSVAKGDSIMVSGKLKLREYEVDGQKRQDYQIAADAVAVSVRYGVAKTSRVSDGASNVEAAKEALGASEIPF